jgi:hypothetical protein
MVFHDVQGSGWTEFEENVDLSNDAAFEPPVKHLWTFPLKLKNSGSVTDI